VVLGVNHQECAEAVAVFAGQTGVRFPLLLDPEGTVADRYRATGVPVTWLIDREGRLRAAVIGYRDWAGPGARAYLEPWLSAGLSAAGGLREAAPGVQAGGPRGLAPVSDGAVLAPAPPTLEGILRGHWPWRLDVLGPLALAGVTYLRGFTRLRRRSPVGRRVATPGRLVAYLGGLYVLALALLSPLDGLAELSLTAHMVQHQLLAMVAPPLLLLGNPYPVTLWGLPVRLRRAAARPLQPGGALRAAWRGLTFMPVAGTLYMATLTAWHLPAAYDLALRVPLVHDLEHLTFFGTAVLFWWPVVDPPPRLRRLTTGLQYGLRIGYLVLATAATTLIGAVLGLAERVLYPTYALAPRLGSWTALDDQAFGGGVMWSSSHMFLIAVLILLGRAMDAEGRADVRARSGVIV
jgi:cytochrome c oxidase assembly factor CtaG